MTHIFDGKNLAYDKEILLTKRADSLRLKGVTPKLVSILIGESKQSEGYLNLKKNAAKRCGIEFELLKLDKQEKVEKIIKTISKLNSNPNVNGVMIQLPLPVHYSNDDKRKIINSINRSKDVDGMREDGTFTAPVVLAVETAFSISEEFIKNNKYPCKIVIVGSNGFVGRKLVKRFNSLNPRLYAVIGVDVGDGNFKSILINADILISATGEAGLIKKDIIKKDCVLIDVGSPLGDIQKEAYNKALFVSPVPGGVGPLTIYYLMENMINASLVN